jgi:hypothetical protein
MAWVKFSTKKSAVIRASLDDVQTFLLRIAECGHLMPGVRTLEEVGPNVYHYVLEEVSNGAIRFTPDYEVRFDISDSGKIRWEPHGEHNFRSWGVYRTEPTPSLGEVVLEIETRAEASVPVDPILVPMLQPFAKLSSDKVTEQFIHRIKDRIESPQAVESARR